MECLEGVFGAERSDVRAMSENRCSLLFSSKALGGNDDSGEATSTFVFQVDSKIYCMAQADKDRRAAIEGRKRACGELCGLLILRGMGGAWRLWRRGKVRRAIRRVGHGSRQG